MRRIIVSMCYCGILLAEQPAEAIEGPCTVSGSDGRFDAVAAFGRTNALTGTFPYTNHFGNGVLIAPDKMLLARHLMPTWNGIDNDQPTYVPPTPAQLSMSFRFRRKPDGSVGHCTPGCSGSCNPPSDFFHVEVASFTLAPIITLSDGSSFTPDLVLAQLQCEVTHIEPATITYRPPFGSPPAIGVGTQLVIAGWGREAANSPPVCPPATSGCPTTAGLQPSLRLKAIEAAVTATLHPVPLVTWSATCGTGCYCGALLHDSGGAVFMARPTCPGYWDLVGIIQSNTGGTLFYPLQSHPAFPLPAPYSPTPCQRADFNNDGTVDGIDLGILLANWGPTVPFGPVCTPNSTVHADVDCQNGVNGVDLGWLLGNWGPCGISFSDPCEPQGGGEMMSGQASDDDFYQWVMQATLEELFQWFWTGSYGPSISDME